MNRNRQPESLIENQDSAAYQAAAAWRPGDRFRVPVPAGHPMDDGSGGFMAQVVGVCPSDPCRIVGDLGPDVPDEWRLALFWPQAIDRMDGGAA